MKLIKTGNFVVGIEINAGLNTDSTLIVTMESRRKSVNFVDDLYYMFIKVFETKKLYDQNKPIFQKCIGTLIDQTRWEPEAVSPVPAKPIYFNNGEDCRFCILHDYLMLQPNNIAHMEPGITGTITLLTDDDADMYMATEILGKK